MRTICVPAAHGCPDFDPQNQNCDPPRGCLELNLGLLQQQQVLLASEQSACPLKLYPYKQVLGQQSLFLVLNYPYLWIPVENFREIIVQWLTVVSPEDAILWHLMLVHFPIKSLGFQNDFFCMPQVTSWSPKIKAVQWRDQGIILQPSEMGRAKRHIDHQWPKT